MSRRIFAIAVIAAFLGTTLGGCIVPDLPRPCDAEALVQDGITALAARAHPEGGVAARTGDEPDPRLTAWVLIAAAVVRRTGHEGAFDPWPHLDHLQDRLPEMTRQDGPVDSVANNLSLARVAFQSWGRPAAGILLDPPQNETLQAAWEARYSETSGQYGTRFNEHLFAAFAAWLFEAPNERHGQMADHTARHLADPGPGGDPTTRDAWWAAYARAALGRPSVDTDLAVRLEATLRDHQTETGGVRGFAQADQADASTTAAAILAWQRSGEGPDGPRIAPAVAWLCSMRHDDGAIPFSPDQDLLVVKTTAEVVIAVSLTVQPVPWGRGDRSSSA